MQAPTLTPNRYRQICIAALVLLVVIVVTGAAVRLTGSGLGCSDWPHCNAERFVDVTSNHAAIEQINRLFTGLVSVSVAAAVLGALWRRPRRRLLVQLSIGLVAGIIGQILLGAIVVWAHLHPVLVQGHMVLSLVLVGVAVVLVHRAGEPDDAELVAAVHPTTGRMTWALATLTGLAILAGTVVTGAGPHAGDEDVERLGIAIPTAARVHGVLVMSALALAVVLAFRAARRDRALIGALQSWIFIGALQAAIGYVQYFNDVPELLVGAHILGATVLWAMTIRLVLATSVPAAPEVGRRGARGLVQSAP